MVVLINLCLLINRDDLLIYGTKNKKKYVKGYGFLSIGRNLSNKYGKQLLDTAGEIGPDALKTAPKKVVH